MQRYWYQYRYTDLVPNTKMLRYQKQCPNKETSTTEQTKSRMELLEIKAVYEVDVYN